MHPVLVGSPVVGVLVATLLLSLQDSSTGFQLQSRLEPRRPDSLARVTADVLNLSDEMPDSDDPQSNSDEVGPVLEPRLSKRRKGPTLSVVNPLEILRQRLMLDMARRRMLENQQQIEANAALLEDIGKRAVRQRSDA